MKKEFLYSIFIVLCAGIVNSCKKTTVGFLSPNIHYEQSPIVVPKGRDFSGSSLNTDGSSLPISVKVLHYYDKATGKIVDDVFAKKYPVQLWTGLYNSLTDTTLNLINAKRKSAQIPGVSINAVSGQIIANFGALSMPSGEYQYDLQISNDAGTKVFPKIGDFVLKDTTTFDSAPAIGSVYDKLFEVGNENVSSSAAAPIITVLRVADTPNTVTVQFLDKNGMFFNPKKGEIARRPNSGLNPVPAYLQTLQDYAISYKITDNSMVFTFPFTPFPLNSLGNGFNIYYRIPTQYAHIDGKPDGMWSLNPRFPLKIYVAGAYTVTMQFPDITRVPAP